MPQMLQRPQTGRSATPSARHRRQQHHQASPESQAQDANLKLQLALARQLRRSDRDRHTCVREAERRERDVLLDLARILDSRRTPSIDEWFERRKVTQTSQLPETPAAVSSMLSRLARPAEPGEIETSREVEAMAAATSAIASDRQRILEVKRSDWFGISSVPFVLAPQKQRPQTAAVSGAAGPLDDESQAGVGEALASPAAPAAGSAAAGRLRAGTRRVMSAVAPRTA